MADEADEDVWRRALDGVQAGAGARRARLARGHRRWRFVSRTFVAIVAVGGAFALFRWMTSTSDVTRELNTVLDVSGIEDDDPGFRQTIRTNISDFARCDGLEGHPEARHRSVFVLDEDHSESFDIDRVARRIVEHYRRSGADVRVFEPSQDSEPTKIVYIRDVERHMLIDAWVLQGGRLDVTAVSDECGIGIYSTRPDGPYTEVPTGG